MTMITKTLTGAALAVAVAATTTAAPTSAFAWKKSSDAELVNRMIHALAPGHKRAKRHHRHKHNYGGWKRKRYGYKNKRHHKHYNRYGHRRGYVSYDGRFHSGFANRYGWGKKSWIYKSRRTGHLDLQVFFRSGSAQLSHRAYRVLDSLGDALSYGSLRRSYFKIGGHTDAAGSYETNHYLAKRRAQTVKNYLTRHFDISPRRLVTVGYGESRLAYPGHPYSKKNRRVEVSVISKRQARRIRNRHDDYAQY